MQAIDDLHLLSNQLRKKVLERSFYAQTQHIGSCLSCIDLLVGAYFSSFQTQPQNPSRDRLIFSKGHAALALYVTLEEKGYLPKEALNTYNQIGSVLTEHPSKNLPFGIEASSGSLGHGLSLALGMALGMQIQKRKGLCVAFLSDGECNEGSVWEAALLAPKHVERLICVVDFNKWQATGRSQEISSLSPLDKKFEAFGWKAIEIDGHNLTEILDAYTYAKASSTPTAVIAHTVKGKGISFMENDNNWHYRKLCKEEYVKALKELSK